MMKNENQCSEWEAAGTAAPILWCLEVILKKSYFKQAEAKEQCAFIIRSHKRSAIM